MKIDVMCTLAEKIKHSWISILHVHLEKHLKMRSKNNNNVEKDYTKLKHGTMDADEEEERGGGVLCQC